MAKKIKIDDRGWSKIAALAVALVPVLIIFVIASFFLERADKRTEESVRQVDAAEEQRRKTFPVPPMDLVVPAQPRTGGSSRAQRRAVTSAGEKGGSK